MFFSSYCFAVDNHEYDQFPVKKLSLILVVSFNRDRLSGHSVNYFQTKRLPHVVLVLLHVDFVFDDRGGFSLSWEFLHTVRILDLFILAKIF